MDAKLNQEKRSAAERSNINFPPNCFSPSLMETKYVYLVFSFVHARKQVISNEDFEFRGFTDENEAKFYMKNYAKDLFNSKACHHTGEMDTQSTYYREESDYTDFVNDEEGYRSSLSEWGYVKITLDDTSNE